MKQCAAMGHRARTSRLGQIILIGATMLISGAQPAWAGTPDCNSNGVPDELDLPTISWPSMTPVPITGYIVDFGVGDMDDNGAIDIVAALSGPYEDSSHSLALSLNEGDGTFAEPIEYPSSQPIFSISLAHLDGNDALDVVMARVVGFDRFLNRGNGVLDRFASNLFVATPWKVLIADVSGDGVGDFVLDADFTIFLNDGNGHTTFNRKLRPAERPLMAAADYNTDGTDDVLAYVRGVASPSLVFFLGTGSTSLQETVELRFRLEIRDLETADFDGDGDPDAVAFFNDDDPLALILNRGHPNYEVVDVPVPRLPVWDDLEIVDADSDGRPDIVLNGSMYILLNRGNGAFVETSTELNFNSDRTRAVDVNGDGARDLLMLSRTDGSPSSQPLALALAQIESGNSLDCNRNRVPDECELGDDCNENGVPDECDLDSDGDGHVDGCDVCPDAPDTDLDLDGVLDCLDGCPEDRAKVALGSCGCRVPDLDPDSDGIASCLDRCPLQADPRQLDLDGDLTGNACDDCPADPLRISPRYCGCGAPDPHSDTDGFPDCIDGCPLDRNKQDPLVCGCDVAERDLADVDGDGRPGCIDNCPFTANPDQADSDRDRFGDVCDRGPDQACPGDCDRDLRLDTADFQMAARAMFGSTGSGRCSAQILDHDSSGSVRANDVVAMIGSAWRCRPIPTPATPTPTPTPLLTGEFEVSATGPDPQGGLAGCAFSSSSAVAAWNRRVVTNELGVRKIGARSPSGPPVAFEQDGAPQAMACLGDGGSIVVLRDGQDLRMRRLDSSGAPVGPIVDVHEPKPLRQWQPSIACPTQERCIVTWTGETHASDNDPDVFARIFDSLLTPLGPTFRVGVSERERRRQSEIRALPGGDLLVAWAGDGIRFRFFDQNGTPAGAETTASTTANTGHQSPDVAVQSSGDFLLAWVERDRRRISVRPFSSNGSPRGPEVVVVAFTEAQRVALAPVGDSNYLLAWRSIVEDEVLLYIHTLDSSGEPMGEPVRVAENFISGEEFYFADGIDGRAFLAWKASSGGLRAVSVP